MRAKATRRGTLRWFFRFCVNRNGSKRTTISPAIELPIGANRIANKGPFTDAKLERIIDASNKGAVEWETFADKPKPKVVALPRG